MKNEIVVDTKKQPDGTWTAEIRDVAGSRVEGCKTEDVARGMALLSAVTSLVDERAMRMRRLELQPGDLVVIEAQDRLPLEVMARIRAAWLGHAPGTRPVIFDGGMKLSAVLGLGSPKPTTAPTVDATKKRDMR